MKLVANTLYGLLVATLVVVAGFFISTLLPLPGGFEVKIVKSGSMEPAIPTGALVVIAPQSAYAVGEVITFGPDTTTNVPTTHRVVEVRDKGQTFVTKGDANEEQDTKPVVAREVIGKVLFSVPYAGFVLDAARKPMGFALLIGLPALLIIIDELWSIFGEVKRFRRAALSKKFSDPLSGGTSRLFSQAQHGSTRFFDIRPPQTIRQPAEFVGRLGAVLLAGSLSTSLVLGNVGSTVSYFADLEHSLANVLQAGVWGPPPPVPLVEVDTFESFSIMGTSTPQSDDAAGKADEPSEEPPTDTAAPDSLEPFVVVEEGSGNPPAPEPDPAAEPEPAPEPQDEPADEPADTPAPQE